MIGLVYALGQLHDGSEEYVIVGPWEDPEWLKPYTGPNQRLVRGARQSPSSLARVSNILGPLRPLALKSRQLLQSAGLLPTARQWPDVPISAGYYEDTGCSVVHFPFHEFTLCSLPSIYNPHDLQHLHYPQFFIPSAIAWREVIYPAGCHFARTVVVASQWVRQDIVQHYSVNPDKIQVIPCAPPTEAEPEPSADYLAMTREKYHPVIPFAIYPAMTWEHKNHIRLLEALALLRDRDQLRINLICTGNKAAFWPRIEARLLELGLQDQVRFLGLVPGEDLRALYQLCQFVVVPTLFEAASGPLFEAWQEGVPVTCSTVTSLPEQAGDAALLFDPLSVVAIADAIARMATSPQLREDLRRRGTTRLKDFSWERTAKAYRAVYRQAAGLPLTEEERWLLSWDWMRDPRRRREDAQ